MKKIRQLFLLSLALSMSYGSQGQVILPPVSSPDYNAAKSALIGVGATPAPSGFDGSSIMAEGGLSFNDGCFTNPDGTYSTLARNDDGSTGRITLPFTFLFYGTPYTSIYINNNGNITFDAAYNGFTSSGFPTTRKMIAPFWADVDTRNTGSREMVYKVFPHKLIATWPGVGYFGNMADKLDSFQVIITDGTDPEIGIGNNVAFRYAQMRWTTGSASGGVGGFGGTPATVGINAGDGINYIQIGRFGMDGYSYTDNTSTSGVRWLEYNCLSLDIEVAGNIPPIVNGIPTGRTDTVYCGQTKRYITSWLPPEFGQTISTTATSDGACGITVGYPVGYFSSPRDTINITGAVCNLGSHLIRVSGTDNMGATTVDSFTIVVVPAPTPNIYSNSPVCAGNTLTLGTSTLGTYSWAGPDGFSASSPTPSISSATASATGEYSLTVTGTGGCVSSATVSVNVLPSPTVSGVLSMCQDASTTLTASISEGTFYSLTPSVASIGEGGVVNGLSVGTATISYVTASGCGTSVVVTVNAQPTTISGTDAICAGASATFTSSPAGGSWTSLNPSILSINASTGEANGIVAGTATIKYTTAAGCYTTKVITVNALPSAIFGLSSVCVGNSATYTSLTSGVTWSVSEGEVASIDMSTGVFNAYNEGTVTVSATSINGCTVTKVVSVAPAVTAIEGSGTVCVGGNVTLTNATTGGTWSASPSGIVNIFSAGIAYGFSAGAATITYMTSPGCWTTLPFTVNPTLSFTVIRSFVEYFYINS